MSKKKTNPRNKPVTRADKQRAKQRITDEILEREWAILFTVLRDKEGFGIKRLRRLWEETERLCTETLKNPLNIEAIMQRLETDVGLSFDGWWRARARHPRKVKTAADLKRESMYSEAAGQDFAWAVFLDALSTTAGYGAIRLLRVVSNAGYLKDSLAEKRITVRDLALVLRNEAGIDLV